MSGSGHLCENVCRFFERFVMLDQMAIDEAPSGRVAGIVLTVCTGLAIVAMLNHPTAVSRSPGELMTQIAGFAARDRVVHGVFFAVLGGLTLGASVFACRQGFDHIPILAGFITFAFGVAAACGAIVLDGFVIPDVVSRYLGSSPEQINIAVALLTVCGLTIQILGKLSVVAVSLGILLWSVHLIRMPGALRASGIVGLVSGILPLGLAATGARLTPHSLSTVIVVQAIWYFVIGALLIRGRL